MAAIVTSTYRYKPPPKRKGRKLTEITGLAIVTIDPKTRVAKKGRRPTELKAAAEAGRSPPRFGNAPAPQSTTKPPQPANDDGPREPAIVTPKKGRRLALDSAAAQVGPLHADHQAGRQQSTRRPPPRRRPITPRLRLRLPSSPCATARRCSASASSSRWRS